MNRRIAIAGLVTTLTGLFTKSAAAQVQTVVNDGNIVSTGDVWVQQDAAGNQQVFDAQGRLVATQTVGNDLRVTSTGDVVVGQRAAGSQTVAGRPSGICEPGEFVIHGCSIEICTEECEWTILKCPGCRDRCKGKC